MRWKVVMALMILGFMGIWGSQRGWAFNSPSDEPGWNGKANHESRTANSELQGFWQGCKWISSPRDIPVPEEVVKKYRAGPTWESKEAYIRNWQKQEFRKRIREGNETKIPSAWRNIISPFWLHEKVLEIRGNTKEDISCSGNPDQPCEDPHTNPCGPQPGPDRCSSNADCGGCCAPPACVPCSACPCKDVPMVRYNYSSADSTSIEFNCNCKDAGNFDCPSNPDNRDCGRETTYVSRAQLVYVKMCSCEFVECVDMKAYWWYQREETCVYCCRYGCAWCSDPEVCTSCWIDTSRWDLLENFCLVNPCANDMCSS